MLSILYSDFEQFGCPNCGCDAARGSCSATCRHCGLHFEVRGSTVYSTCEYAAYPEDPENPRSEYVMEQAIRIPHPRIGIPSWHWMPKDERPEEGEYWSSRGVGYDLSGFVRTKKAGERILDMVHEVLGTKKCKTYLDYRPNEPTWIQFKFDKDEFNLDAIDKASRAFVVQRYKDIIIPIGEPMGRAYTTLLAAPISAVCFSNKVKILSKGTLIKL